jgi:hypothetical protein
VNRVRLKIALQLLDAPLRSAVKVLCVACWYTVASKGFVRDSLPFRSGVSKILVSCHESDLSCGLLEIVSTPKSI